MTAVSTQGASVARIALESAQRFGSQPALTTPRGVSISYAELGTAVRELAGGLAAIGVEPGDRVAILASTRPEWTLADYGALAAAAVVVPIYATNSPEECAYVLRHSGSRVVICENGEQLAKIDRVRNECPELEAVVLIEGAADGAIGFEPLRAKGREAPPELVEQRLAGVGADDPATIVYTSGTTGPPKGCVTTHGNLLATAAAYEHDLDLGGDLSMYLYLPLAHSLARIAQAVALRVGGTLAFWSGDAKRIVDEVGEAAPTHFPSVPRVYEKIHTAVLSRIAEQGRPQRAVFAWALEVGRRARTKERAGTRLGPLDRARLALADRLALSKVRDLFGGRLELALTGAAPIGRDVLEFFDACGVTVLEGYGMTESCAAGTLNRPGAAKLGTVGRALTGTEVMIASDGEVLMRGPHIFAGYHRDEAATAGTVHDGWLHSGDLGEIDRDGFLTITGRKKDLIITSSGKNISPDLIESMLRETRWISQAVVHGDRRPYLVALITLDPDELESLAAEAGAAADPVAMAADPRVREIVQRDVDAVNARLARIEQIKRFAILERDLTQADGELTPTLKVKRAAVQEAYADRFRALYEG